MTPARILIVEDDRVVARDIAQRLHRIGHSVVGVAARAEEDPDDAEGTRERFDKLRRGELTSYSTQLRIYRKDGQLMWWRFAPAAPEASISARLISADVLLAACGGDAAILRQIRDGLRARLPGDLAAVQGALRARDARQLRELAHGVTGMLAAFSTAAAALASELEDEAAAGDLDAAARLVERLSAVVPRLLAALGSVSIDSLTADLTRHPA